MKDQAILGHGTGVAMSPYQTKLMGEFNAALKVVIANRNYKKIAAKCFEFDVCGKQVARRRAQRLTHRSGMGGQILPVPIGSLAPTRFAPVQ